MKKLLATASAALGPALPSAGLAAAEPACPGSFPRANGRAVAGGPVAGTDAGGLDGKGLLAFTHSTSR